MALQLCVRAAAAGTIKPPGGGRPFRSRAAAAGAVEPAERFRPLRTAQVPLESAVEPPWDPDQDKEKRVPGTTIGSKALGVWEPRYTRMPIKQDWPSVWPAAATFKPSVVPLPVRQGWQQEPERRPPPDKWANLELMKIPNFLHLTPVAIERHCEALKPLCTEWPSGLADEPDIEKYRPLRVTTSDYVHAGPDLRDARARRVTLALDIGRLRLGARQADKLRRLLGGDKVDAAGEKMRIVTDRCPRRKQNFDYAMYLLTVLYFESNKVEGWESEATIYDDAERVWHRSAACDSVVATVQRLVVEHDRLTAALNSDADGDGAGDIEERLRHLPPVAKRIPVGENTREAILQDAAVVEFADLWQRVMNGSGAERWQEYAHGYKKLFGFLT